MFWIRVWLDGRSRLASRSLYRIAEWRKDSEMWKISSRFCGAIGCWEGGEDGGEM
jgi:hypothetical protein